MRTALVGRRVVVTRSHQQAHALVAALRAQGAEPVVVPAIAIETIADAGEIAAAVARLRAGPAPRWLAFTSANAARIVANHVAATDLSGLRVAAVGRATMRALHEIGVSVDLVPIAETAEALARALLESGAGAGGVWLPQAEAARPILAEALGAAGARVMVTAVYRTVSPSQLQADLEALLLSGLDAITFFSSSAVDNVLTATSLPEDLAVVCIGEVTAQTAIDAGLQPYIAGAADLEAVVAALVAALV